MANKIILFTTLTAYSIIVSQSFMYLLSLKHAQMNLEAGSYIELRKLIDASMRSNFKFIIYAALLSNLLLVLVSIKQPNMLLLVTSGIALLALVADIVLTLKGNLPINDTINSWTTTNYPSNWAELRNKWFTIFHYRQIATIIGFVSLLIGTVLGGKQ